MASIRRTPSPYHHLNGASTPFSVSPPHKLKSRKYPHSCRFSLYRYLLFFALGFILGLFPFGHVDDVPSVRTDDFAFDGVEVVKTEGNMVNSVKSGAGMEKLEIPDGVMEGTMVNSVKLGVEMENFEVPDRVEVSKTDGSTINSVKLGVRMENFEVPDRVGDQQMEKLGLKCQKQLIIITPTYNRALQAYFLNRLGQVLRLVRPPLLWIVVEMKEASVETAGVLRKMGVTYRHLVCKKNSTDVKDRGVHQRNTALEHIERHRLDGIVYLADDDNVYSLELFESLREIRQFGTWPVAMLAHSKNKAILEGPVCNGSQVVGWHTNEKSKRLRRFHVDMSGFAFNSTILWDPKRWRRPTSTPIRQLDTVKEGFQETTFIEQLVEDEYQMEGISPSCSRIMNWHLHLEGSKFAYPRGWML